jgi:hypothetical protein
MAQSPTQVFCTILAQNYLPKALALAESLKRQHGATLKVMLIDVEEPAELPKIAGVEFVSTEYLGLGRAEIHRLAGGYGLVEFATSIKAVLLQRLLEDAEQAAYLDPDMYLTGPMPELGEDLAASPGGILLTPHFLRPPGPDAFVGEGHLLHVGYYNLGFIAVDHRAGDFLAWWAKHLEHECLFDPMSGLFVDQKWLDLGSVLFHATAWEHPGYNVSIVNLHERPVSEVGGSLVLGPDGSPLRLFHFHAFDPKRPSELSTRFKMSTADIRASSDALDKLCHEYAQAVLTFAEQLPPAPPYRYARDSSGHEMGRQVRRAYRLEYDRHGGLPSPFDPADKEAYAAWRKRAWKVISREVAGDAAKAARLNAPTALKAVQERFPALTAKAQGRFVSKSGGWG